MRKKVSNKHRARRQIGFSAELSTDLRIVLIEQGPLRRKAGRDARKQMEKAAALEGELSEYERTILPAFNRWEEEHLGELIAEEKSLEARIDQLDFMIGTAYREALMSGISPGAAYRELEKERREDEELQRAHQERMAGGENEGQGTSEGDPRGGDEASFRWTDPDAGLRPSW